MSRTIFAVLLVLALPCFVLAEAHVDAELGIAFNAPDKWNPIPTPKKSKYESGGGAALPRLVAKWESPRPDADNRAIGLELFALPDAASPEAAADAWIASRAAEGGTFRVRRKTDLRAGAGRARLVHGDDGDLARVAGVYGDGTRAFALVFSCGASRADNRLSDWTRTLQSFRFLSPAEIERARARGRVLPAGWQLHKTASYDIEFNCDKAFAATIGVQLEAILLEYQRFFPLESFGREAVTIEGQESRAAAPPVLERMTVKLFKDEPTFQAYAHANGVKNAAAYFSPAQNELVGYKTVNAGQKLSIRIMYHEAMHQYLHALYGDHVDIPIWLNEGMAEYFFGGEFNDRTGRFVIDVNKERIDVIRLACKDGSYVPLEKMFRMSQAEYYANAGLCYAQGWSMAYFLWRTEDAKYRGLIEKFMKRLRQTKCRKAAFAETFGTLDLEQLEKDWIEFVTRKM